MAEPTFTDEFEAWASTRTMRLLDWLEATNPYRSCVLWLPGFVRPHQVDGPRRFWRGQCAPWWRESDLSVIVPLLPLGLPCASRTRRLRRRG